MNTGFHSVSRELCGYCNNFHTVGRCKSTNVCRSGPLPEHAEDSEEDETPVRTGEIEYEQGDRLFMTRVLPKPTAEELRAASTTSQKLTEGACRSAEAQREPFTPPDCVRGFESIFAKEDFCHKLHSAISPSILHRFSRSQWLRKALEKTFRSVPVTSRGDQ